MSDAFKNTRARRRLDFVPELKQGFDNLRAHKLRSLLTMLGMIFGVAAVVAMMSIGAGAQQQVMAFIEQLGVRNLIVEAREAADDQTLQKVRTLSAGLSFQDLRVIHANVDRRRRDRRRASGSCRPRSCPSREGDIPTVYGVGPAYQAIAGLRVVARAASSTPARTSAQPRGRAGPGGGDRLFGAEDPVGEYVKVNEQWFRRHRRRGTQADRAGRRGRASRPGPQQRRLRPAQAALLRIEDAQSYLKDEIDGIYLQLEPRGGPRSRRQASSCAAPQCHAPRAPTTSRDRAGGTAGAAAADAAALRHGDGGPRVDLAARRRHRHHEHHAGERAGADARDRRAPRGWRTRQDIVRQFLVETTLITVSGGVAGDCRRRPVAAGGLPRRLVHGRYGCLSRRRLRGLRHNRYCVWSVSRRTGGPARSGPRPPLRIASQP